MDTDTLIAQLTYSRGIVGGRVKEFTHEESLIQPQPAGNCMNWVLGHLVQNRNDTVRMLGKESPYPADKFDRYRPENPALTDTSEALPFTELLECFNALEEPLFDAIRTVTDEALAAPFPNSPTGNPDETVGSFLPAIVWHESYHIGQLALLRRIVEGKPATV